MPQQLTGRELIQKLLDPNVDLDAELCVDMSPIREKIEDEEGNPETALSVPVKIDNVQFRNGEIVLQASAEE